MHTMLQMYRGQNLSLLYSVDPYWRTVTNRLYKEIYIAIVFGFRLWDGWPYPNIPHIQCFDHSTRMMCFSAKFSCTSGDLQIML